MHINMQLHQTGWQLEDKGPFGSNNCLSSHNNPQPVTADLKYSSEEYASQFYSYIAQFWVFIYFGGIYFRREPAK